MKIGETSGGPLSPIPLPDLEETIFDGEGLERYIQELRSTGAAVEVTIKGASRDQARPALSLASLQALFRTGEVHSAQLRYRLNESGWIDTLMVSPEGVRLIRMAH